MQCVLLKVIITIARANCLLFRNGIGMEAEDSCPFYELSAINHKGCVSLILASRRSQFQDLGALTRHIHLKADNRLHSLMFFVFLSLLFFSLHQTALLISNAL